MLESSDRNDVELRPIEAEKLIQILLCLIIVSARAESLHPVLVAEEPHAVAGVTNHEPWELHVYD